jgi:Mn2+/Fe2+ NRAMP family transporter
VFVGGALVNACGVAGTGLLPLGEELATSKILWGIFHSLLGLLLVRLGGFRVFGYIMGACVGLMFLSVVATTVLMGPDWAAVVRGMLVPTLPDGATGWILGVLGGVGGTVTLLSYGYWIREQGRTGSKGLRLCRLDLALGYGMTALFGLCMIVIGSNLTLQRGPLLALELAEKIAAALGPWGEAGKWIFLVGFWGAVFSSLLGVWQSVPYLFADFVRLRRRPDRAPTARGAAGDLAATGAYGGFLWFLALAALPWLWGTVRQIQLLYAVFGAFFMPLLALTLLLMNNRRAWVTAEFRNGWVANLLLGFILALFAWIGMREILPILVDFFT